MLLRKILFVLCFSSILFVLSSCQSSQTSNGGMRYQENYPMYDGSAIKSNSPSSSTNSKSKPLADPNAPKTVHKNPSDSSPVEIMPENSDEVAEPSNTEEFTAYTINDFVKADKFRNSTFSIDVDTASFTFCRNKINLGYLPQPESVRVEEFLNYYNYNYAPPTEGLFTVHSQVAENPFNNGETALMRVALKAKEIPNNKRRPAHLTFLIDVSGSMSSSNKLPLVKKTLEILVENLVEGDTVGICTYASGAEKVLEPADIDEADEILDVIDDLSAAGSTAGEAGLRNAYEMANDSFDEDHINRVIMCTDGDFNVGNTDGKSLLELVNEYSRKGITLSIIGYGLGNYKDKRIEQIANSGNGNYFYVSTEEEAQRIFGENISSTLEVVAADVKIQLEFNPAIVDEYRLIGYENRSLKEEEFRMDIVDAGEVGPGHSVTAVYELKLFKQKPENISEPKFIAGKIADFRIRFKNQITDAKAQEVNFFVDNQVLNFAETDLAFKFATAVTGFADILRKSKHAESWRLNDCLECAIAGSVKPESDCKDFTEIVRKVISLKDR